MSASPILATLIAASQIAGRGAAPGHSGAESGSAFADLLGPSPEPAPSSAHASATLARPQTEQAASAPPSISKPQAWSAQTGMNLSLAPAAAPAVANPWADATGFADSLVELVASAGSANRAASPAAAATAVTHAAAPPTLATAPTKAPDVAQTKPAIPLAPAMSAPRTVAANAAAPATVVAPSVFEPIAQAETAATPSAQPAPPPSKFAAPTRSASPRPPATANAIDGAGGSSVVTVAQIASAVSQAPMAQTPSGKPGSSGAVASAAPSLTVAKTDDSLSAVATEFPNANLSAAMQTIAQALSGADIPAPATQNSLSPHAIVPSTAELRNVQTRTHLTVSGSRLFTMASPRAREALDSTPTIAPTSDKTFVAAAAPGDMAMGSRAEDPPSSATFTPFVAAEGVALNTAATGGNSVSVNDLADRLATEASNLASEAPLPARGAVKELEFQLEPADLGSVGVRLRLTTAGLSVDINVSNPNALAALEKQRDSMTAKLDASSQPLESLVIQQQSGAAFHDPSPPASGSPSFVASGDSSGDGSSRRSARDLGQRSQRMPQAASANSPQSSSLGALVV